MSDVTALPKGKVISVNLSEKKGTRKTPVGSAKLVVDRGFEDDAHAGDWHRQISLLARESIDKAKAMGLDVKEGDFGENITTEDIDLLSLPIGTILCIGDAAVVEISQIGKVCHTKCAIYYLAGDCIFPREGIFAVVHTAAPISVGDEVKVIELGDGHCARTPQSAIDEFAEAKAKEEAEKAAAAKTPCCDCTSDCDCG